MIRIPYMVQMRIICHYAEVFELSISRKNSETVGFSGAEDQKMPRRGRAGKYIVCCAVSAVVTLLAVGLILGVDITRLPEQIGMMRKVNAVDSHVAKYYLNEYDMGDAMDYAANGYVAALGDRYAEYFSADEQQKYVSDLNGERFGIGITLAADPRNGKITAIYVNRKSPAEAAGIQSGDVIAAVNGISADGKTVEDIVGEMTGKKGEKLSLTLIRGGKELNISLAFGEFEGDSVTWRVLDGFGVIEIMNFDKTTDEQFDEARRALQSAKVRGYIIDLRDNPGGTLDECCAVLDRLLPEGVTCRVEYKNGETVVLGESDSDMDDTPLCLLVNENSASAAEVFASAIRDFSRGKIIGTKTYGKGIMQSTYDLPDGSAVKFTTARIVDKNGDSYHEKGILPDIESALAGELPRVFLNDREDSQMQAAVAYMKTAVK